MKNDMQDLAQAGAVFPELEDEAPGKKTAVHGGVVLVCGSTLTPKPVAWLWDGWLALGKLHVLAGAPGQGKTTIALAMMATVTIGGRWPDGSRCAPGNVLIWSGEDDPADTLLPRLIAMGADKDRVFFVGGATINGEVVPFDPARDLPQLLAAVEEIGGIGLLVVDPIVSAVTGDSHKNTEVRRALQPLVDLAATANCAVLGISHFAKGGQGSDPTQRVIGSVAFSAVARVVMVAAKVKSEDEKDSRILARTKSNIGPDGGGFEYHLDQKEALPGINASYVTWGKSVDGTARELLTDPDEQQDEDGEGSARDQAEQFLIDLLKEGPSPTSYVTTEAKAAGVAWRTVRRASETLGIKKRKTTNGWYWSAPDEASLVKLANLSNIQTLDKLDNMVDKLTEKINLSNHVGHVVQPSNLGQVGQVDPQQDIVSDVSIVCEKEKSPAKRIQALVKARAAKAEKAKAATETTQVTV